MSRRKQARPIRVLESEDGLETSVPSLPGEGSVSSSEEDAISASGCKSEDLNRGELKKDIIQRKDVAESPQSLENEEAMATGDEEEDDDAVLDEGGKRQEEARRQRQDAENNNSIDEETEAEGELAGLGFPFPLPAAAGHVTLEALQNTKVAVAQFAATAMANNADNAAALQELAVLQSTLYTLQHQQMMQLTLIQQLQQQLQITRPKDGSPPPPPPPPPPLPPPPPPPPPPPKPPTPVKQQQQPPPTPLPQLQLQQQDVSVSVSVPATTPPTTQSVPPSSHSSSSSSQALTPSTDPPTPKPPPPSPPVPITSLPPCSISSSFASSIITNLDPPPSPNEPNTLEMLQRRAQEVLDNASQGLLANNLADELAFRKNGGKGSSLSSYDSKSGGRNEPFFKHRCRYCGKVFGSDSALQIHIRSHTVRGNTTCNICFKTFACNSALEIHYRSHTKERPFKCTICDRGFSTKGNMKQHMLTHKIRDMPPHLFEHKSTGQQTPGSLGGSSITTSSGSIPGTINLSGSITGIGVGVSVGVASDDTTSNASSEGPRPLSGEPPLKQELPVKRSPPEGESVLPLPKRQPSLPKHLCHVCNKNFSSSSALQIHMRTHTGDKPFRCTICHKAFTTKGNLKVHMGTHMWTNGASRRGRRMSLDLPPLPKDSDFLHRRPDLFYPYLPAPFLNGMQQKLNEISVIQNVNSNMSNGLLNFSGFGGGPGIGNSDIKPGSPGSDKTTITSPCQRTTPPLWDLHYERKPMTTSETQMDVCPSPPPPPPPPTTHVTTQRGEGLAA